MLNILKPSLSKIALTITMVTAASFLWRAFVISRISDSFPLGFPFQFYQAWGPCPPGETCSEFNGVLLLCDVILWYAVSAWVVDRVQPAH